ncbi:hypothetical protein GY45DRAFT_1362998 [Cubamyces sp. BRFM 1775]|nr:hypothetical protein GY45DRAFT_1362998 [Cubamyces sp. BRFM 1775]
MTEYTPTAKPGRCAGDICVIYESPNVPVHEILTGLAPRYATGTPSDTTETVGTDVQATPEYWRGSKKRPCIVTKRRSLTPASVEVCLMATFGHTAALKDIPEILQRFCVPIYPHTVPSMQHLHTCPEWLREDAWVLARRTQSASQISKWWKNNRSETPEKSAFKADEEALLLLLELCERKQEAWEALLQEDPQASTRCLKEYGDTLRELKRAEVKKRQRKKKRSPGLAASPTSAPPLSIAPGPSEQSPPATSPESSVEDVPMVTTPVASSYDDSVEMARVVAVVTVDDSLIDPGSDSSDVGDATEKIEEEVAAN